MNKQQHYPPVEGTILVVAESDQQPQQHQCFMTSSQLHSHLRESQQHLRTDKELATSIFNNYFIPNTVPARCVACGKLIAQHPNNDTHINNNSNHRQNQQYQQQQSSSGTSSTIAVVPQHLAFPPPSNLEMSSSTNIDIFKPSTRDSSCCVGFTWTFFLFPSIVMIIVFIALAAATQIAFFGYMLILPFILLIVGILLLYWSTTEVITFDKTRREIIFERRRFVCCPCCCPGQDCEREEQAVTYSFDNIVGTESVRNRSSETEDTSRCLSILVRRNVACDDQQQREKVVQESLSLGAVSSYEVDKWRNYLRGLGCANA